MKEFNQEAENIRVGLITGVYKNRDVILWADRIIESNDSYPDELLDLSLMPNSKSLDILSILSNISQGADKFKSIRMTLPIMHDMLVENNELTPIFARGLYELVLKNNYNLPDDFNFMIGIDDEYSLVEQEVYSKEDIVNAFISELNKFK